MRLAAVARTVLDLERCTAFHRDALGLEVRGDDVRDAARGETRRTLAAGDQRIELVRPDVPGRPYPEVASSADRCFQHCALVVDDIVAARERLCRAEPSVRGGDVRVGSGRAVAVSADGPVTLPASSGGVSAFKFRDPEGHPLELIEFPPGANPAWPARPARARADGVRGIDHSAIVVADVEASLRFYTGSLGLRCTTRQVNRGAEQARLDALHDPEVEVVGLVLDGAPPEGAPPHLELLGYRRPPVRAASGANAHGDVATDVLVIEIAERATLDRILERVQASGVHPDALPGGGRFGVRDPDGHRIELRAVRAKPG